MPALSIIRRLPYEVLDNVFFFVADKDKRQAAILLLMYVCKEWKEAYTLMWVCLRPTYLWTYHANNSRCSRLWRKPVCSDYDAYVAMCFAAEIAPDLARLPAEIVIQNMNESYASGEVYTPSRPFWGVLFTACKRIVYEAWYVSWSPSSVGLHLPLTFLITVLYQIDPRTRQYWDWVVSGLWGVKEFYNWVDIPA